MADNMILLPILAHIFLVVALYILLGVRKSAAVKAGGVDRKATALNNKAWPESVVRVSNNIDNNFEAPMLFYGVCIVSFLVGATGTFAMACAFGYVALRYIHSYVHISSNYVPVRLSIFALSLLTILAMAINVFSVIVRV